MIKQKFQYETISNMLTEQLIEGANSREFANQKSYSHIRYLWIKQINKEIDRRRPDETTFHFGTFNGQDIFLPIQEFDQNGQVIINQVIGYDEQGAIWLN